MRLSVAISIEISLRVHIFIWAYTWNWRKLILLLCTLTFFMVGWRQKISWWRPYLHGKQAFVRSHQDYCMKLFLWCLRKLQPQCSWYNVTPSQPLNIFALREIEIEFHSASSKIFFSAVKIKSSTFFYIEKSIKLHCASLLSFWAFDLIDTARRFRRMKRFQEKKKNKF